MDHDVKPGVMDYHNTAGGSESANKEADDFPGNSLLSSEQSKHFKTQWKGWIVPMNDHSDKEAVLYTCPRTQKDYRFILHRKNHQKADNYACARCKSRKKYVRILISGEYFLEDPALLDHICYLDPDELRKARENTDKMKSMELIKERQRMVKRQRVKASSQGDEVFDIARIPHETPLFPMETIARLFEDTATVAEPAADIPSTSPPSGVGDEEEEEPTEPKTAPPSSVLDTLFQRTLKAEQEQEKTEERASDPEPKELPAMKRPRRESFATLPNPTGEGDDGSFQISLNRALSGLKKECRSKAENEILRFVYSKLYEKYGM